MGTTERYQFTVDESDNFCVRAEGSAWCEHAGSKAEILGTAEAMAIHWFGEQFFGDLDKARVVDSHYDDSMGTCYVTVSGPVGSNYDW